MHIKQRAEDPAINVRIIMMVINGSEEEVSEEGLLSNNAWRVTDLLYFPPQKNAFRLSLIFLDY